MSNEYDERTSWIDMSFEKIDLNRSSIQRSSKCHWCNHMKNESFYSFIFFQFIIICWVENSAWWLKQFLESIICCNCQWTLYMKRLSIAFCSISYYQSSKFYINDSHRYLFSRRLKRSIIVNDKKVLLMRKVFAWRSSQYCINLY